MKKTYNQPTFIVVELSSRNVMVSVSAESLGMGYKGTTEDYNVNSADVKNTSDVNVWDKEW